MLSGYTDLYILDRLFSLFVYIRYKGINITVIIYITTIIIHIVTIIAVITNIIIIYYITIIQSITYQFNF